MQSRPAFNRLTLLLAAAGCAALVAACGGGGSDSGAAGGGTYAAGRISGFGSIIVNGVHYDDSRATVTDDDDGSVRSNRELKLGMTVEVEAHGFDDSGNHPTATASSIGFSSLVRGPVELLTVDGFVALGQTVKVTATTVFDDSITGGLAGITVGTVVKVYGTLDATTGVYTATRIEAGPANEYRLRGVVASVDATAKTLTVGTAVIDLSRTGVPTGLKAGDRVRVKLLTAKNSAGQWVATELRTPQARVRSSSRAEIEGTISSFTSATSFSVDGTPVDASQATFEDGTSGLAAGVRVEVEGALVDGVLVARKVKIEDEEHDQAEGFEVDGPITSVDAAAKTLVVRDVTVTWTDTVVFKNGTAASLVPNQRIEVKGALSADGRTLTASSIEIKR